jgi:hypothetical protein
MTKQTNENYGKSVWGIILVGIGIISLAAQFIEFKADFLGWLLFLGLGAGFLTWGIISRQAGPIIPGGILTGLGLGILLVTGPYANRLEDTQGGAFMLAFAAGWVLITLLTAVFTQETQWWALIPAAIMALVGGGVLFGGVLLDLLSLLGKIWPIFLILGGIAIIYQGFRSKENLTG